jgi:hypothetical protein
MRSERLKLEAVRSEAYGNIYGLVSIVYYYLWASLIIYWLLNIYGLLKYYCVLQVVSVLLVVTITSSNVQTLQGGVCVR